MKPWMYWFLFCFCLFWVLYAIGQELRASYWKRRYNELRNSAYVREAARQLGEEQDFTAASAEPPCICGTVFEIHGECQAKTHVSKACQAARKKGM